MTQHITLIGDDIFIDVDDEDFYPGMLNAITDRVFQLLGPQFDKQAYLDEVEKRRRPKEIGEDWAVPVAMLLALELGYCLGQLKNLGKFVDIDQALKDLYAIWKTRLRAMLEEERLSGRKLH
jgi:hypothetical protein